jgi:hypothetical protein
MNWMTSGRKRLAKTQKSKELRSFHFSSSAASRPRATRAQAGQSADVTRLKCRWGFGAQATAGSAAGGHKATHAQADHRSGLHRMDSMAATSKRPPSPFSGPLPVAASQEYDPATHRSRPLRMFNDGAEVEGPEGLDHSGAFQDDSAELQQGFAADADSQQQVWDDQPEEFDHAAEYSVPDEVREAVAGLSTDDTLQYLYEMLASASESGDAEVQVEVSCTM